MRGVALGVRGAYVTLAQPLLADRASIQVVGVSRPRTLLILDIGLAGQCSRCWSVTHFEIAMSWANVKSGGSCARSRRNVRLG